jgi:hypothetical protein
MPARLPFPFDCGFPVDTIGPVFEYPPREMARDLPEGTRGTYRIIGYSDEPVVVNSHPTSPLPSAPSST